MEKVKIAFAGGRLLGVRTLKWLASQELFDVIAVCPVPLISDPDYYGKMTDIINENSFYTCDIDKLIDKEIDIGLSVNYHKIIGENILNHCKKGFYNVHHSYNLRLRGRNITTHALLNTLQEDVFYHGTTLHLMVSELDAGGIVASEAINIETTDTAYSLFNKTDEVALKMIIEWFPRIAKEKIFLYHPPEEGVHSYKNSDLPSREININMSEQTIDSYIRAFDFPGKEPAYIQEHGRKIYLVFEKRDQYNKKFVLHGKTYYTE